VESIAHDTAIGPPLSIDSTLGSPPPPAGAHRCVTDIPLVLDGQENSSGATLWKNGPGAWEEREKRSEHISFHCTRFSLPFPLPHGIPHASDAPSFVIVSCVAHNAQGKSVFVLLRGRTQKRETFGRHRFFAVQHGISGDSAFPKMREKDLIINDLMKISPLLLRTTPVRNGKLGRSAKHLRLLFLGRGKLTPVSIKSKRRRRLPHSTFHRVKTTVSPDKNLS